MAVGFREIKADVLARLARGEWAAEEVLPTELALAAQYGCARATVGRALGELAQEGYLDRRRKAGTRVRRLPERHVRFQIPLVRREIEETGAAYGYRLLARDVLEAPEDLRARMGLAGAAPVLHLRCLHSADGLPYQLEDRHISLDTLPAARDADFDAVGPNEWLLATIPFTTAEISFSAVPAGVETAELLGCAPGTALFLAERSTWRDAEPVTCVRLWFRPGHRMTTRY